MCGGGRWCQVSGVIFCALVIIEEIKSPCGGRSFGWDKIGVKGVSFIILRGEGSNPPFSNLIMLPYEGLFEV